MTQRWVRFIHAGLAHFGLLEDNAIRVCDGDMFKDPRPSDTLLRLADVRLLTPTQPSKIIALWNNFRVLAERLNLGIPDEPLYLLKAPNSYLNPDEIIRKPSRDGKVAFEGELGIVIGKVCKGVSEEEAMEYVFGYTCANDVTAPEILNRNPAFAQWARAKGFDTFCPFGPTVATGLDPAKLVVKTFLNGELRQNYPISDMVFSVPQLVNLISREMTLFPGDIILCGTSVGVGSMKSGSTVEVEIAGIGKLSNRIE